MNQLLTIYATITTIIIVADFFIIRSERKKNKDWEHFAKFLHTLLKQIAKSKKFTELFRESMTEFSIDSLIKLAKSKYEKDKIHD